MAVSVVLRGGPGDGQVIPFDSAPAELLWGAGPKAVTYVPAGNPVGPVRIFKPVNLSDRLGMVAKVAPEPQGAPRPRKAPARKAPAKAAVTKPALPEFATPPPVEN
jgi:hypothetical protein